MRRSILLVAALAAVATSACQRKAEGQTVAVVNNEEITAAELNAELARANLPPGVDKKEVTSRILQALIDRRLLAQQARADGLDKTPDFLNRQRQMTENLLIQMLAGRQLNTAKLPSPQEIERFQASHPQMFAQREIWYLDQLQYETPTDAAVRAQIDKSKTLADIEQALTTAGARFGKTKNRIDTSVVPLDIYRRINGLGAGVPFIVPAGPRSVASVITNREPAPLAGDAAKPVAVAALRREQGTKLMENRLKAIRTQAKIEYKPGFAPK